jgi:hypothetical protein
MQSGAKLDRYSKQHPQNGILWVDNSQLNSNGKFNSKLHKFRTSKIVRWVCHEDANTLRTNSQYDMINCTDLLSELGVEINFNTQRIIWEGVGIPMKEKHVISELQNATAIYYQSIEATEAEARQTQILDTDYNA